MAYRGENLRRKNALQIPGFRETSYQIGLR
jgi:hypothetical protein